MHRRGGLASHVEPASRCTESPIVRAPEPEPSARARARAPELPLGALPLRSPLTASAQQTSLHHHARDGRDGGRNERERIATVLKETGHASFYGAVAACDVPAVRALVAAGADADEGDIIVPSANGQTQVVRQLARLGCSLYRRDMFGWAARDYARQEGHHDVVLLLTDLYWAGGWRLYAAARRMPYVRIRHEVSKTYKVLKTTTRSRTWCSASRCGARQASTCACCRGGCSGT